jgi:hypothetical protein
MVGKSSFLLSSRFLQKLGFAGTFVIDSEEPVLMHEGRDVFTNGFCYVTTTLRNVQPF